jgi:hypothetical protein
MTILYTSIVGVLAPKEAVIELDRDFLERYKNRVTIDAEFIVDNSRESPNPDIMDGDLHVAGRAPEIGLRLVAEIINAASAQRARAVIQRAESTHAAVRVTGAWRLWPEHAVVPEAQGEVVPALKTPNPDHIFEIHPVTRVGSVSVRDSFHPVEGYRPGSARRTFDIYQRAECVLKPTPTGVTLTVSNWLYNDVHFLLELTGNRQVVVADGRFVTASALDTDGNLLVEGLRMVFTKGTPPERIVRSLKRGARLHVWGLPRVSFAEISHRISQSAGNPAVLKGNLPYEILVLGVYPDEEQARRTTPQSPGAAAPGSDPRSLRIRAPDPHLRTQGQHFAGPALLPLPGSTRGAKTPRNEPPQKQDALAVRQRV